MGDPSHPTPPTGEKPKIGTAGLDAQEMARRHAAEVSGMGSPTPVSGSGRRADISGLATQFAQAKRAQFIADQRPPAPAGDPPPPPTPTVIDSAEVQKNLGFLAMNRWNALDEDSGDLQFKILQAQSINATQARSLWSTELTAVRADLGNVSTAAALDAVDARFRAFLEKMYSEQPPYAEGWQNVMGQAMVELAELTEGSGPGGVYALDYLMALFDQTSAKVVKLDTEMIVDEDYNILKATLDSNDHRWRGDLFVTRQRVADLELMLDVVGDLRGDGEDDFELIPDWDTRIDREQKRIAARIAEADKPIYKEQFQILARELDEAEDRAVARHPYVKNWWEMQASASYRIVSGAVGMVVEAVQQLRDLNEIFNDMVAINLGLVKPEDIEFKPHSDLGEAAAGGATTTDLLQQQAWGMLGAPVRLAEALYKHNWEDAMVEAVATYGLIDMVSELKEKAPPKLRAAATEGARLIRVFRAARAGLEEGMAPTAALEVAKIAKDANIIIQFRPVDAATVKLRESGAIAKPEWMKMKSINELDFHIGADVEDFRKVGFFEPTMPKDLSPFDAETQEAIKGRFKRRQWEWEHYSEKVKEMEAKGEVELDGKVILDKQTGQPFAGDYDMFSIRSATGKELVFQDLPKFVQKALGDGSIQVQHGAHATWMDIAEGVGGDYADIVRRTRHPSVERMPGEPAAERLINFHPDGSISHGYFTDEAVPSKISDPPPPKPKSNAPIGDAGARANKMGGAKVRSADTGPGQSTAAQVQESLKALFTAPKTDYKPPPQRGIDPWGPQPAQTPSATQPATHSSVPSGIPYTPQVTWAPFSVVPIPFMGGFGAPMAMSAPAAAPMGGASGPPAMPFAPWMPPSMLAAPQPPSGATGPQVARVSPGGIRDSLAQAGSVGMPLPAAASNNLQQEVPGDASHARVHTDPAAARVASDLGALAFTIGRDIFFGPGQYDPHSREGQALIGHELTHVVQQTGSPTTRAMAHTQYGGDALEQEAQQVEQSLLYQVGRKDDLSVEIYSRAYDAKRLSQKEQDRLDALSVDSLIEAGRMLRTKEIPSARIDEVNVTVDVDLQGMEDAEIVIVWASAIARKIEEELPKTEASSKSLLQMAFDDVQFADDDGEPEPPPAYLYEAYAPEFPPGLNDYGKYIFRRANDYGEIIGALLWQDKRMEHAKEKDSRWNDTASSTELFKTAQMEMAAEPGSVNYGLRQWGFESLAAFERFEDEFADIFADQAVKVTGQMLQESDRVTRAERARYFNELGATEDLAALKHAVAVLRQYQHLLISVFLSPFITGMHTGIKTSQLNDKTIKLALDYYNNVIGIGDFGLSSFYAAYKQARDYYAAIFPILGSDSILELDFHTLKDEVIQSKFEQENQKILKSIHETADGLTPGRVWSLPHVMKRTQEFLGMEEHDMSTKLLAKYQKDKEESSSWREKAMIALMIGLTVLSVATAGATAPLTVAVGTLAGLGATTLGAIQAHQQYKDYKFGHAASQSAYARANAICEEDPSFFWLAVTIALTILDMGAAIGAFKTALRVIKEGEEITKLRRAAEQIYDSAERQAANEGKTLEHSKEEFVEALLEARRAADATASVQGKITSELLNGTSHRVSRILSQDKGVMKEIILQHGNWGELVSALEVGKAADSTALEVLTNLKKFRSEQLEGARLADEAAVASGKAVERTADEKKLLAALSDGREGEDLAKGLLAGREQGSAAQAAGTRGQQPIQPGGPGEFHLDPHDPVTQAAQSEKTAHYPRAPDGTVIMPRLGGTYEAFWNVEEAVASYHQLIERTPGREVSLWHNVETGEYMVTQGNLDSVSTLFMEQGRRGAGAWHGIEHFHPGTDPLTRVASAADFRVMAERGNSAASKGMAESSQIRYLTPAGVEKTSIYGFDPNHAFPYYVKYLSNQGVMQEVRFGHAPWVGKDYENYIKTFTGDGFLDNYTTIGPPTRIVEPTEEAVVATERAGSQSAAVEVGSTGQQANRVPTREPRRDIIITDATEADAAIARGEQFTQITKDRTHYSMKEWDPVGGPRNSLGQPDAKYYINSSLNERGILDIDVRTVAEDGALRSGRDTPEFFDGVFNHYGDKVKGINSDYTNYNLAKYQEAIAAGKKPLEAAVEVPTAKYFQSRGFKPIAAEVKRDPSGVIDKVVVHWRK